MKYLAIWGEDVTGKVDLEIQYIYAVGCTATFPKSRVLKGQPSKGELVSVDKNVYSHIMSY